MKYRKLKGWKYELAESISVHAPELGGIAIKHPYIRIYRGILTVLQGYAWDGATGVPDNPDNMEASLFHDALYQLMREGMLSRSFRNYADKLFRSICIRRGMKKHWADFIYNGLKALGEGATKPDKHPKGEVIEI